MTECIQNAMIFLDFCVHNHTQIRKHVQNNIICVCVCAMINKAYRITFHQQCIKMPCSINLLDQRDLAGHADEQAGLCKQVTCLIAEVKADAQPRLFRNGTRWVYIAPRITAPFLHCPGSVIRGEGSQLLLMGATWIFTSSQLWEILSYQLCLRWNSILNLVKLRDPQNCSNRCPHRFPKRPCNPHCPRPNTCSHSRLQSLKNCQSYLLVVALDTHRRSHICKLKWPLRLSHIWKNSNNDPAKVWMDSLSHTCLTPNTMKCNTTFRDLHQERPSHKYPRHAERIVDHSWHMSNPIPW